MKIINISLSILITYLSFTSVIYSQNTSKIDSLKTVLANYTNEDTLRVNMLNDLAQMYQSIDTLKASIYLNDAAVVAKDLNYKRGIARNLYLRGVSQVANSKFDQGLKQLSEALQLYKSVAFKRGIAQCYYEIGILFYNKGNSNSAIESYTKSLDLYKSIGDKEKVCEIHNLLGNANSNIGDYAEALKEYEKAIAIGYEINNQEKISDYLNNIGTLYGEKGNYPQALNYFKKSLFIKEALNDTVGYLGAYGNIGLIYKLTENYDKAITYYDKALKIQETFEDKTNTIRLLNNMGLAYTEKKEYTTALQYLKRALKISEDVKHDRYIGISLNNIGYVYLHLNEYNTASLFFHKGKKYNLKINNQSGLCIAYLGIAKAYSSLNIYDKALINALKSKDISDELKIINYQRDVSELLAEIYTNTKHYKKALASHQQFKLLNDSLFNKKNIEKITQIEYEYKYKQQLDSASMRELKLTKTVKDTSQNLEKSQRSFLWAIIGFLVVSILLGGIVIFMKFRNIKSKTQNIVIEQKLLRSQMTPHFIFNSLSVLQGMILNKEEKKSVLYLSKFSKLLRIILENSRDKVVSLSQELAAIENYLALQNLENEVYTYIVSAEDKIDIPLFEIPPMLIQPFVENAIEHAFVNQNKNRIIEVKLTYINKRLICHIKDNGIGINASKGSAKKNKSSLATTITSDRLKILAKDLKMEGSVTIEDRNLHNEQGTTVTLVIPHKINTDQ